MNAIPPYGEFDYFNLFPEFQGVAEEVNLLSLQMVQRIHDYVGVIVSLVALVLPLLYNRRHEEGSAEGYGRCGISAIRMSDRMEQSKEPSIAALLPRKT